ncbi:hypothetical protein NKR23_g10776 [Pleurostoma richardsiae]|uniref:Uncharacterized protein n=1 Tax=Pleurostoma richardsiae TaxID=41990 RepID=A0AA38R3Y6_9PEZI|nr:hypothetical protein NKR23_g10776 [Pleurostoma richardsiae]
MVLDQVLSALVQSAREPSVPEPSALVLSDQEPFAQALSDPVQSDPVQSDLVLSDPVLSGPTPFGQELSDQELSDQELSDLVLSDLVIALELTDRERTVLELTDQKPTGLRLIDLELEWMAPKTESELFVLERSDQIESGSEPERTGSEQFERGDPGSQS